MSFPVRITTTPEAYERLSKLDTELVGSPDYLGLCWFWHHDYRHNMRAATPAERRRVHAAFIKAGLDVEGTSKTHAAIVERITEPRLRSERERSLLLRG
jgi:hypothetical protein